jgi:hypothetical protein
MHHVHRTYCPAVALLAGMLSILSLPGCGGSGGSSASGGGGGGGGATGVGGGTTTTSTGSGFASAAQELCQDYLDCLDHSHPEEVAGALPTYGVDGSCWTADAQTAETCGTTCFDGMKGLHHNWPTACPECYADSDCVNGACNSGDCLPQIPLPNSSAACKACADFTVANSCGPEGETCAADPECMAIAECVAACNGDADCVYLGCYQGEPPGYDNYYFGVIVCVICTQCTTDCDSATWCQG